VVAAAGPIPFYVVGRNPPATLRAKASVPGVVVTGTVDDVRAYYGKRAIAVVPLRMASGIINKVLEPMAMGTAVVASSLAVAGLDVPGERVALVADDAAEFARAVVALIRDPERYARLARDAAAYVREAHVWPTLMQRYRERIENAVASGPTTARSASPAADPRPSCDSGLATTSAAR